MERLVEGRGRERKEEWARQWEAGTMPSPLICVSGDRVFVSLSAQLLHGKFCGATGLCSASQPTLSGSITPRPLTHKACHSLSFTCPGLKNREVATLALQTPVLEPTGSLSLALGRERQEGTKSWKEPRVTLDDLCGAEDSRCGVGANPR